MKFDCVADSQKSDTSDTNASDDVDSKCSICSRLLTTEYDYVDKQLPIRNALQCPKCDFAFASEFCLRLHLETHFERRTEKPKKTRKHTEVRDSSEDSFFEALAIPDPSICYSETEWFLLEPAKAPPRATPDFDPMLQYHCDRCSRRYQTKASLTRHMRVNHIIRETLGFPCPMCGWKFVCAQLRDEHVPKHGGKSINCVFCSKVFNHKKYLRMHYLRLHQDEINMLNSSQQLTVPIIGKSEYDDSYPCGNCGRMYKSRYTIMKHLEVCSAASPMPNFICKDCGKGFLTESQKDAHAVSHNGKTVLCCYCDAIFAKMTDLKAHVFRMHLSMIDAAEREEARRDDEMDEERNEQDRQDDERNERDRQDDERNERDRQDEERNERDRQDEERNERDRQDEERNERDRQDEERKQRDASLEAAIMEVLNCSMDDL